MIIQLGALFSSALSGLGGILSTSLQAAAPSLLQVGNQFLARELNRKLGREQQQQVRAKAVQVLNTPGISVARVGGTIQPVGGRVQRSTFSPAATTPAQSPIGNIPLLPVGFKGPPGGLQPFGIPFGFGFPQPSSFPVGSPLLGLPPPPAPPGLPARLPNVPTTALMLPKSGPVSFMVDAQGNSIKFVPSPTGQGFITVQQALQAGLKATKPWWRFNQKTGMYEKMKGRRMNPFNFKAAARAGRRIDATLDAVKEFVRIEKKMSSGKVRLKRRKKRKR